MDEDSLIAALTAGLPQGPAALLGPGDDSAVVAFPDGRATITTDILVDAVHFRSEWSSGFDVGWRLAAQNLADAAAMGAVPTALVVALAGPPDQLAGEWGSRFSAGLATYCGRWDVGVVGGDLSTARILVACGTAFGDLEGRQPVTRSGARPGDVLAVSGAVASPPTGDQGPCRRAQPGAGPDASQPLRGPRRGSRFTWPLGGSAAGLAVLQAGGDERSTDPAAESMASSITDSVDGSLAASVAGSMASSTVGLAVGSALAAYRRPDPPLDQGKAAALAGATAMLDISDGLGKDAARLAKASQVRLIIEPSSPVLAEAIEYWRPLARMLEHDPADWVLGGGEDHALLATFPAEAMLPDGWRGIGHVLAAGEGGPGVTIQGAASTAQGWDHFA